MNVKALLACTNKIIQFNTFPVEVARWLSDWILSHTFSDLSFDLFEFRS